MTTDALTYCLANDNYNRAKKNHLILEKMKNPDISICEVIESKMYEILDKIKQIDDAIEADPLHSELRILDWILYHVCSNEINEFERI